jgi:hypothetical protein
MRRVFGIQKDRTKLRVLQEQADWLVPAIRKILDMQHYQQHLDQIAE